MDFAFTDEQEMLRAAARDYLADRYPLERVVALVDGELGWDPQSWHELAGLGWLDPDLGTLEQAVVVEEAGYALYPGPWWSTVVLCGGLATSERPATLAGVDDLTVASRSAGSSGVTVHGGRITGRKPLVPDAAIVEVVLVVANDGIYAVEVAASGVTVVARSTTDRSRRYADLVLEGAPCERVAGRDALPAVRRRALALAACEAVGVGQRCLDLAVSYARERAQFGRPVGSYQGVSHRLANSYLALQLARSLAYWAAWCVAAGDDGVATAAPAAKAAAGEAAVLAAENAIQSMGGIGFTWEHPLHRFYKRAQWLDSFAGNAPAHRAALAKQLLDGARDVTDVDAFDVLAGRTGGLG